MYINLLQNKLVCLAFESISTLVKYLKLRLGAYKIEQHIFKIASDYRRRL